MGERDADEVCSEGERLRYEQLLDEEFAKPMAYFGHDSDAHSDVKLRRLRRRLGYEGIGMWWTLCELLAGCEGHYYDVSDDDGWQWLSDDLGVGVEDCQRFVRALLELSLLNVDSFEEFGRVRSARLDRNAQMLAGKIAGRRFGAEKTNAKRWGTVVSPK